jgi:hypothetical protein
MKDKRDERDENFHMKAQLKWIAFFIQNNSLVFDNQTCDYV